MTESEGTGIKGLLKTPSRFLFDINDKYITRIGHIGPELMREHRTQTVIRNPFRDAPMPAGTRVKHKLFGEGVIESLDMSAGMYMVRFLIGTKPISFNYVNLWKLL